MAQHQRIEETKAFFVARNLKKSDDEIKQYAHMLDIVSNGIHHKLSTEDLARTLYFFSDVLLGKRTRIVEKVKVEDAIITPYRMMEQWPPTTGKLDSEEKKFLAFCVFYATYDNENEVAKKKYFNRLDKFTDEQYVLQAFEANKTNYPQRYQIEDSVYDDAADTFGFTPDNPIPATTPNQAYFYMSKLRPLNGKIQSIQRIKSSEKGNEGALDVYEIKVKIVEGFFKYHIENYTIYTNPKATINSLEPPKGFRFR